MSCNYSWLSYEVKFIPSISPASKYIRYDQKTKSISASPITDFFGTKEPLIITVDLTGYLSDGVSKAYSSMNIIFEP